VSDQFEQALRDAAHRELRLAIGKCNTNTPADDVTAILRNMIASGLDEIITDRLLKMLGAQTGDGIDAMRRRFRSETKAQHKAASASAADEAKLVDDLNEQFAVVNDAGKILVMRRRKDPVMGRDVLERIEFADFKKMHGNRTLGGKEIAKIWLSHPDRKQYLEGIVFDPSNNAADGWLNMWRGFAIEPASGNWSLMQEHLLNVVSGGNADYFGYLLSWAAFAVQHPNRPAEVAVVLRGGKGSGKGIFGRWLRRMFGQHGMQVTNSSHLVGKFHLHLRDFAESLRGTHPVFFVERIRPFVVQVGLALFTCFFAIVIALGTIFLRVIARVHGAEHRRRGEDCRQKCQFDSLRGHHLSLITVCLR